MSGTIKAGVVQHPDSSTANLTLNDDGTVDATTVTANTVVADNIPGHNLLHNGAMQVAQRGTTTTAGQITATGYYTADRWDTYRSGLGNWTQTVESDAPTGSGFAKSLKTLCYSGANASPAATDRVYVKQIIEGQNLQSVKKGTADAEQLTVSFWTKSNVTGTYVVELWDLDNTRHVAATYTIASSATWERQTVTFPADLTGAFDNNNEGSLEIDFWLAAGSNYTSGTLPTTWAAATAGNRAVGQTNLAASTNNYWSLAGVQLEVGSASTGYEFKGYEQELAECQRYYQKSYEYGTVPGTDTTTGLTAAMTDAVQSATRHFIMGPIFPVAMRTAPTLSVWSQDGTADKISEYANSTSKLTVTSVPAGAERRLPLYLQTSAVGTAHQHYCFHYVV